MAQKSPRQPPLLGLFPSSFRLPPTRSRFFVHQLHVWLLGATLILPHPSKACQILPVTSFSALHICQNCRVSPLVIICTFYVHHMLSLGCWDSPVSTQNRRILRSMDRCALTCSSYGSPYADDVGPMSKMWRIRWDKREALWTYFAG